MMAGLAPWPGRADTAEGQHHRAVAQLAILQGYEVTITFTATDTVTQRHSLNRAYRGCILLSSSAPTGTPNITVLDAETASRAGTDIRKYFTIGAESSWTGTVTIWLF